MDGLEVSDNSGKLSDDVSINLYPNPTSGFATLDMNFGEMVNAASVRVLDFTGRVVYTNSYTDLEGMVQVALDLNGMPNGIYPVVISSPLGTQTRKLIVNQ
ncbi:MAG: T9SS type A sorting domain-containing protein [Bacteroidetes bacterium]|nr:T9SS type A sorting domain-containing protein [Bacteroidota bacterium]